MAASNDNDSPQTPAGKWRTTTVYLDPQEFFSDPGSLQRLFNGEIEVFTPPRSLVHHHRFQTELESPHPHAVTMRMARRCGINIRQMAHEEKIDFDGDDWIPAEKFNPTAENLTTLFNGLTVSAPYRAWQAERTTAFVQKLVASPFFQYMIRNWADASADTHSANGFWLSRRHQETFSNNIAQAHGIVVKTESVARVGSRLVRGSHLSPRPGDKIHEINLNTHPDTDFHVPATGLDVIFHENTHAVHTMLATAFIDDRLPEGHALRDDARLLLLASREKRSYLPAIREVYRAHPTEEDTFRASATFVRELDAALAPHNLSLHPRTNAVPGHRFPA